MKKKSYSVKSLLICDDVRVEHNGKEILIGVYASDIILAQPPPVNLPKLVFRIELIASKSQYKNGEFSIVAPRNQVIFQGRGALEIKEPKKISIVSFEVSPVKLPAVGKYAVRFGLDSDIRKIGEFNVRVREDVVPLESSKDTGKRSG